MVRTQVSVSRDKKTGTWVVSDGDSTVEVYTGPYAPQKARRACMKMMAGECDSLEESQNKTLKMFDDVE